jgi:hypothetical protein
MRKHLSIFMLIARSTIYKVLGIFIIMTAAEISLFYYVLNKNTVVGAVGQSSISLESLVVQSRISWVFAIAFILVSILLCLTGCEFKSKQGYTLRRLSVTERNIYLWQALYNTCCYFFLWIIQLFVALVLCKLYLARFDMSTLSNQAIFLAFYRNSFLHSLLPLDEISRFVRNVALIIGLGTSSACFPFRQRRGKIGVDFIVLVSMGIVFFVRSMGGFGNDMLLILTSATIAAESIAQVIRTEAPYEA